MSNPIRPRLALSLALLTMLSGCVTPSQPQIHHSPQPLLSTPATVPSDDGQTIGLGGKGDNNGNGDRLGPRITRGTGEVINEKAAAAPPPNLGSTGEATFNFEGESLHAVVKAILGDLLQQNYVIAPNVQGTVTLATPRPVNPAQALSLLEMVLGWNNARLIWSDGRYNVVPSDAAVKGNLSPRTGSPDNARGYEVRAVPLKYISATEMQKIIEPYARDRAVVQVDAARNLIVLAGTRAELENYLRTVQIFDVDWLAGMSVGVFPLQSSEASKMVDQLEKVFGENSKTPVSGMFRFMPLEGQNAVMVITSQPKYLREVEDWIDRMDAGGNGSRLYVYDVKYIKASDLSDELGSVYGSSGGSAAAPSSAPSLMPSLEPVEVKTDQDNQTPPAASQPPYSSSSGASGPTSTTLNIGGSDVGISAVEESNALLIRASPAQWESIRRAIDRLDIMPLQVHIEAQVVEVKLTGDLSYGVSWFFGNALNTLTTPITSTPNDWQNSGTTVNGAGGGSFTFLGPSAEAIVKTLDSISDVHVLSAPSVLVRNNVEANFDSGTQIPVASTIINNNGNTNSDNTVSNVQFRQTGISLKVKPRVSSNGMVFLEITQDVSSPSATGPVIGGNVSVDNRKLHTEVAVQSGETVMLAGLIKTEQTKGSSGIPYLSRLPVIGALFGQQNQNNNRDEVLVLITPTVVRDPAEARKLTDEYSERFQALEPMRRAAAKPAPKQ
jgi:general secretion pathway protein D